MIPSGWHRVEILRSKTLAVLQLAEPWEVENGGRYRIRTYDFHRVNESSGRKQWIYE